MLLNALVEPEVQKQVSAYVARSGSAAGAFLYGVAIIAVIAFVAAALSSLRVPAEAPKK